MSSTLKTPYLASLIAGLLSVLVSTAHAIPVITSENVAGTTFSTVLNPSATDLAQSGPFSLISGTPHGLSGPITVLQNGVLQAGADAPGQSYFSDTQPFVFQVDLGALFSIGQVITFSRHPNIRAPQRYTMSGSELGALFTTIANPACDRVLC